MASDGDLENEKLEGYGYDYFSSESRAGDADRREIVVSDSGADLGVDHKKPILEGFQSKIVSDSQPQGSQDTLAEHWSELDAKDQDVPGSDSKQQPESEIFNDGDGFSPTSNK
jgi:hypothetical protein